MKRLLLGIILLLCIAGNSELSAQCLCGHLKFSIVDLGSGEAAPHPRGQIGRDSAGIVSGTFHVSLRSMDAPVHLSLIDQSTSPLFDFPTGGGHGNLVLEVSRGTERMSLHISNIKPDETFVLGSIPFYPGPYSLDLDQAKRRDDASRGFDAIDRYLEIMRTHPGGGAVGGFDS